MTEAEGYGPNEESYKSYREYVDHLHRKHPEAEVDFGVWMAAFNAGQQRSHDQGCA